MEHEKDPREQYADWKAPETDQEAPEAITSTELKKALITESDKDKFHALSESVRSLTSTLREREDLRFNSLIEEGNVSRLSAAASEVDGLTGRDNVDIGEYESAVMRLTSALDTFGDVPRQTSINDDSENLRRVNFQIRQIGDAAGELRSSLGAKEQESLQQLQATLRNLDDSLEKTWQWIAKKASTLEDHY